MSSARARRASHLFPFVFFYPEGSHNERGCAPPPHRRHRARKGEARGREDAAVRPCALPRGTPPGNCPQYCAARPPPVARRRAERQLGSALPRPCPQGYEELADEAADSLKTLIAELGDPESDGGSGDEEGGEGGEGGEEEDGAGAKKQAKKAKPERMGCGAATPKDDPAVYADCLEVETLLRKLRGEAREISDLSLLHRRMSRVPEMHSRA